MKSGTLAAIKRVKLKDVLDGHSFDGSPYVDDCRSFDIPQTIVNMINNAAPGLVAVTLSPLGGRKMVKWAEHAARKRGIRILWWTYNGGKI